MNLPVFPQDKANHFIYGAIITATLIPFLGYESACYAVLAIGIGKEIADQISNLRAKSKGLPALHGVETLDAVATVAGAATVSLPHWIGFLNLKF